MRKSDARLFAAIVLIGSALAGGGCTCSSSHDPTPRDDAGGTATDARVADAASPLDAEAPRDSGSATDTGSEEPDARTPRCPTNPCECCTVPECSFCCACIA